MDTIYRGRVTTTRLIANRITLPPTLHLSRIHPRSISVVASFSRSSPPPSVPLFTLVRSFYKRPRAKQTYGVLTLNKLSDFVIGLLAVHPLSLPSMEIVKTLVRRRDDILADAILGFLFLAMARSDAFYCISSKPYVNTCSKWRTAYGYYAQH